MHRRHFLATSAVAAAGSIGLPPAATAAGAPALADAVLAAFRRNRLVGLGEQHGLQEHHDALTALLHDPRLAGVVDDVVVEFGNARYQSTVDTFVAGGAVAGPDLRRIWRDTTQSPLGTWDEPVYEQFFRTVRAVNATRPARNRMRVLLGDPPVDWSTISTTADLDPWLRQRDSHAAGVIRTQVLSRGRRALLCFGLGHLTRPATADLAVYSIGTLVALAGDPAGLDRGLSRYPLRTVVPTAGTWLGDLDSGLVLPSIFRGPAGPVNGACGTPLRDLIDAVLVVGPAATLTASRPNPASYLDPAYWAELQRRQSAQPARIDLAALRLEQPVRFAQPSLPPELLCPTGVESGAARSSG